MNYILIDFENICPNNLELLHNHEVNVLMFVGAKQYKVPLVLASAMQEIGHAAQYVKIDSSGKNALDFYIAYYVGVLATKDPDACFYIISSDTGFDPLIKHLKSKNISIQRELDISAIPFLSEAVATLYDDKVVEILKNFARRPEKPKRMRTLANAIKSLFVDKLTDQQVSAIVRNLEERNYITVNNSKITYNFPN